MTHAHGGPSQSVAVIFISGDDVGSQRGDFGFSPSFPAADSSFQLRPLHNHDTLRSPLIHQSFFRLIFTATNRLITVYNRPDLRRSSRPSTTSRTLSFFANAQLFHRSGLSSVFTSPPLGEILSFSFWLMLTMTFKFVPSSDLGLYLVCSLTILLLRFWCWSSPPRILSHIPTLSLICFIIALY